MRKIFFVIVCACMSCNVYAQKFLITKTLSDSIKPGTFHGTGDLALEFKQSDSQTLSLNAGVTMFVPTDRHQFRLAGNFVYNILDDYSNDNKGFACFHAMLFQFEKAASKKNKLQKSFMYYDLHASFNYDYVRDLNSRVMTGMNVVFQPLRNHPHIAVEPAIGLLFSYQNWQVLNPGDGPNTNNYYLADYDAIRDKPLSDGSTVNDYLGISANGRKEQIDPRISASVNVFGVWPRMEFDSYLIIQQPLMKPFRNDPQKDAEVRDYAVAYDLQQGLAGEDHSAALNNKAAPEILFGGSFSVKIWKKLALVTTIEFFYDAGQLGLNSRNLTYSIREGLSISW